MKKTLISRRQFLTAAGVAGVAAALTACGGSSSSTAASTATSTAASSTAAAEIQDVELTVWGAEEDQTVLQTMIDAFCEEYKDKVNLTVQLGVQSESSAKDTVLTDVEAAADIYAFADDQITDLVNAGALQPVADVGTYSTLSDIESRNVAGSITAATVDGTLYAYPMVAGNGYFMFYNSTYFTEDDVQTLDKMMEVAAAAGKQITMQLNSGWYLYSFFGGAGLTCGLADDGVSTTCNWTDDPGVDVVNAILDIAENSAFVSLSDADFSAGVKDGSIIAGVNGSWNASVAAEAWGDGYAACKLPTYTLNGEQVQMASFSGYKLLGVNPHCENVGWAMVLADYLTNESNQVLRYTERNLIPSNIAAAADDAVKSDIVTQALSAQEEFATPQRVGGNYWTPTETLGDILAAGNPDGTDPAELLENCVAGIIAPVA